MVFIIMDSWYSCRVELKAHHRCHHEQHQRRVGLGGAPLLTLAAGHWCIISPCEVRGSVRGTVRRTVRRTVRETVRETEVRLSGCHLSTEPLPPLPPRAKAINTALTQRSVESLSISVIDSQCHHVCGLTQTLISS